MKPTPRFTLLLMVGLASLTFLSADLPAENGKGDKAPVRAFDKLQRGMTPEQVRQLVGAPKRIARQILYHRYREQWLYDTPFPIRLTFDCPRGQKPELLVLPAQGGHGR
jgi:hypothetical protein